LGGGSRRRETRVHPTTIIFGALQIVLIDLLLAGDNALIIALTVRQLPKRERLLTTTLGAAGAVVMRVALTFVAARLLSVEFLKLAGGLFVLWIAFKVLVDASDPPEAARAPGQLLKAVWYVMFADLTMSVDNILAIAGASRGSFELIFFGLAVSIPFVVFSSNLLANLMNRYPVLVYFGAGILGKVAGDMVLTDAFVARTLAPPPTVHFIVDAVLAVALIVTGFLLSRKKRKQEEWPTMNADKRG
jgi:YjbE family integral membrane protein